MTVYCLCIRQNFVAIEFQYMIIFHNLAVLELTVIKNI